MKTRSVFAAIAGKPNAGKSSLLNALIGEKVAVVSDKPQTTRTRITGILTKDDIQYVFADTPGVQKPRNRLGEHMNDIVKSSVSGIDTVLFMTDITRKYDEKEEELLKMLKRQHTPVILLLNKIDLVKDKAEIAQKLTEYFGYFDFAAAVPISAAKGEGLDAVLEETAKFSNEGPHFYPDDKFTDQPERVLTAEMIRGQVLNIMYDEIPHGIAVTVEDMNESVTKSGEDILNIDAVIYCERDSHKGMVIGKGGSMLKKIGSGARGELEAFFGIRVNLRLWVKVKEDWRNRDGFITNFGLSSKQYK